MTSRLSKDHILWTKTQITSRPLNQRRLSLYAQIALVLVINQRFLIVHASLIFYMRKMSRHLNQRFIAKYSQIIFI